jgi:hypothetical protein
MCLIALNNHGTPTADLEKLEDEPELPNGLRLRPSVLVIFLLLGHRPARHVP